MGFFSLFAGAPKDERNQQKDTWSSLGNISKTATGNASDLTGRGKEATGTASNLFTSIAKGDRTALAPAVNAAVEGADAAKREQAQVGTARGGGASSGNQQIEDHTRQLVSSLLGEAQVGAADKLAAIGSGETNQAMTALGIGSETESNLSSLLHKDIAEKDATAAKMWGSLIKGGLSLATAGVSPGGLFSGGGDNSAAALSKVAWPQ
jgi:hypothetical protein